MQLQDDKLKDFREAQDNLEKYEFKINELNKIHEQQMKNQEKRYSSQLKN